MLELGAPIKEARDVQAETGIGVVQSVIDALKKFRWHEDLRSGDKIWREAIGVCGLITPWELADQSNCHESDSCSCRGLYDGVETQRDDSDFRKPLRPSD